MFVKKIDINLTVGNPEEVNETHDWPTYFQFTLEAPSVEKHFSDARHKVSKEN